MQANQSVITDLSKLGKPGHALRPRLLPAGHAAHVPAEPAAKQIAAIAGVAPVTQG